MRPRTHLGSVYGLHVRVGKASALGWLVLWGALTGMALGLLHAALFPALLGALLAVLLHLLSELTHQWGHAWAARRTGYPMTGLQVWWAHSTSLYPRDEPALPAEAHLWRALGGPAFSACLALLTAALVLALCPVGGLLWWVVLWWCGENLVLFTLGALLPLGFTDGSSLWYWWRRRS